MMVEHPVYRVTWGANPAVIEGKQGVVAFYNAVGEAVLWHSDDRLAVAWPYDDRARLAGEHLYEDKTSLEIEEVEPSEAITPARVREIHRELLGKLEAERGDQFWVLQPA
jgi:hypothetical protein